MRFGIDCKGPYHFMGEREWRKEGSYGRVCWKKKLPVEGKKIKMNENESKKQITKNA